MKDTDLIINSNSYNYGADRKEHYDEVIRSLIDKENTIRNQRANWFLVVQGFLITAFCDVMFSEKYTNNGEIFVFQTSDYMPITKNIILLIICSIGLFSSMSFCYVTWKSEKAIQMFLICWDRFRLENKKSLKDYPPVMALTKPIIENVKNPTGNEKLDSDIREWNKGILDMMRPTLIDKILNKFESLMPDKFIPRLFTIVWFSCFIALIAKQVIA